MLFSRMPTRRIQHEHQANLVSLAPHWVSGMPPAETTTGDCHCPGCSSQGARIQKLTVLAMKCVAPGLLLAPGLQGDTSSKLQGPSEEDSRHTKAADRIPCWPLTQGCN